MNEAVKPVKDRSFGVKRLPLLPVPRNPNALLLDIIVVCELHMTMRMCGKYYKVDVFVVVIALVVMVSYLVHCCFSKQFAYG